MKTAVWTCRHIPDHSLQALYLLLEMSKNQCDGVLLTNQCLKEVLGVMRVHAHRATELACGLTHLFPFQRVEYDRLNRTMLSLGVTKNKAPEKPLPMRSIPSLDFIEKCLCVDKMEITIQRNRCSH